MSRLQLSVVLLVAASGALVPLYADASLAFVVAGGVGGALVGAALWWYLATIYREKTSHHERREEYERRERFK